jgi:hypothetical protein
MCLGSHGWAQRPDRSRTCSERQCVHCWPSSRRQHGILGFFLYFHCCTSGSRANNIIFLFCMVVVGCFCNEVGPFANNIIFLFCMVVVGCFCNEVGPFANNIIFLFCMVVVGCFCNEVGPEWNDSKLMK